MSTENEKELHHLPAIKLNLTSEQVNNYRNSYKLATEVLRCKPDIVRNNIKFASIKDSTLIIATDHPETHMILSKPWPVDAFMHGVSFKEPPIKIVIRGLEQTIDFTNQFLLNDLKKQGVFNPVRKPKLSHLVSATTPDVNSLNQLVSNGLKVGFNSFRVEPAIIKCFKCQGTGHSTLNCTKASLENNFLTNMDELVERFCELIFKKLQESDGSTFHSPLDSSPKEEDINISSLYSEDQVPEIDSNILVQKNLSSTREIYILPPFIVSLIKEKRKARRRFLKTRTEADKTNLNRLTARVKFEINNFKGNQLQNVEQSDLESNSSD